ncbi:MAG: HU family DNA-binding protein [candidate division WS1 bacterium]|nr:HU family DNA-binding protein [candidate division WS1 bacterium]
MATVNKAQFVDAVAKASGLSKKDAGAAVEAVIGTVTAALKKGNSVQLTGFGSWLVVKQKARTGINPQTKEKIKIAATKVPKFRAGKALKDAVK